MAGVTATCIEFDATHRRTLVGTMAGFHVHDLAAGTWEEHDEKGWVGRTVWSISGHETASDRVITDREHAFFKGYMEVTEAMDENGTITYNDRSWCIMASGIVGRLSESGSRRGRGFLHDGLPGHRSFRCVNTRPPGP